MMLGCIANCTSLVSSQGKTLSLEVSLLETFVNESPPLCEVTSLRHFVLGRIF